MISWLSHSRSSLTASKLQSQGISTTFNLTKNNYPRIFQITVLRTANTLPQLLIFSNISIPADRSHQNKAPIKLIGPGTFASSTFHPISEILRRWIPPDRPVRLFIVSHCERITKRVVARIEGTYLALLVHTTSAFLAGKTHGDELGRDSRCSGRCSHRMTHAVMQYNVCLLCTLDSQPRFVLPPTRTASLFWGGRTSARWTCDPSCSRVARIEGRRSSRVSQRDRKAQGDVVNFRLDGETDTSTDTRYSRSGRRLARLKEDKGKKSGVL